MTLSDEESAIFICGGKKKAKSEDLKVEEISDRIVTTTPVHQRRNESDSVITHAPTKPPYDHLTICCTSEAPSCCSCEPQFQVLIVGFLFFLSVALVFLSEPASKKTPQKTKQDSVLNTVW